MDLNENTNYDSNINGQACTTSTLPNPNPTVRRAERLSPSSDREKAMLSFCAELRPTSRLACQIRLTDELDGLVVNLPERQH